MPPIITSIAMMNVDVDVENSLMVPASERREILAISVYSFVACAWITYFNSSRMDRTQSLT